MRWMIKSLLRYKTPQKTVWHKYPKLAAEFYEPHQDEKMLGTEAYQLKFPLGSAESFQNESSAEEMQISTASDLNCIHLVVCYSCQLYSYW